MTRFDDRGGPWGPGAPGGDDPYVLWDAAFVLGSLSSAERREFETHISRCAVCRAAVNELSGLPALLAMVGREAFDGLDDGEPAAEPGPEVLGSLMATVARRRRRSRLRTVTLGAVAAAVLAIGVLVAVHPGPSVPSADSPRALAPAMTMTPVVPTSVTATVSLVGQTWGTRIEMKCTYGVEPEVQGHDQDDGAGDKLAMVVVRRDGGRSELTSWTAMPGVTVSLEGSTPIPLNELASVQVVSADTGMVLVQQSL